MWLISICLIESTKKYIYIVIYICFNEQKQMLLVLGNSAAELFVFNLITWWPIKQTKNL